MGHLLGIPVKPTSARLLSSAFFFSLSSLDGATPCASLHHSLVRRNGSGSGGYNIFLEDSFSSAADHGRRSLAGVTSAIRLARVPLHEAIILEFGSRKRTNRAIVSLTVPLRDSRVCVSIRVMKLSLIRRNSSCACHVTRTSCGVSLICRERILA